MMRCLSYLDMFILPGRHGN